MREVSKPKAVVLNVCLSLASVLLCFLMIETYLTLQYKKNNNRISSEHGNSYLCTTRSEDPKLIYTRNPEKCGNNSHGFRDNEYPYRKGEGIDRIVIVGDSVAEGQGVKLKDSFGKVLEEKLNTASKNGGRKVEVIVLAQSGYSTSQELILLQQEVFRYSPDLVIWSYVLNDPAHPVYHNASGELSTYYFKPRIHTAHFISKKLFIMSEKLSMSGCEREYHALLHCVYWEQVDTDIGKIAQISKQNGIPIIFLIHPVFKKNGDYDNYPLAPLHAKLGEAASKSGLPVLDLLNAYRLYKPYELAIAGSDSWHPNEKGHRVAADALLGFINENNQDGVWFGGED